MSRRIEMDKLNPAAGATPAESTSAVNKISAADEDPEVKF